MSGEPALRVELRASRGLTLLTIALHVAAAVILLSLLPTVAGFCAAGLLAVLGVRSVWERTLIRAARAPSTLGLGPDGGLTVRLRNGHEVRTGLTLRRYVSRWLVILEPDPCSGLRHTILVARDMLPPEGFRLLRLWALWNRLPAAHPDAGA